MTNTYFFDVTDILSYLRTQVSVSGIQRVSLAVITRMVERYGADRVKISYWSEEGAYEALGADVLLEMQDFDVDALSFLFFGPRSRPAHQIAPSLERYRTRPFKYGLYTWVRHFHAALGNEGYFTKRGASLSAWRGFHAKRHWGKTSRPSLARRPLTTPVSTLARPGDRVIVMGSVWGEEDLAQELTRLKQNQGVEISILVHDLIPILVPEHMPGGFSHSFDDWLRGSAQYCTSYFANSEYTAKDLKVYLDKQGTPRPIQVVPLAQHLVRRESNGSNQLSDQVRAVLKTPFVLVVGTMDSRKNLLRLAQAWQQLAQSSNIEMPRLIFAGKQNWHTSDFTDWMEKTNHLDGLIDIVIRPSDTELEALYQGCLFTGMVSLYEGWGLPIGEGLSMGKTGVVSDHSSMPEVGGDMVEYCDPNDLDSIVAACRKLITDTDHRAMLEARIAQTQLRSWDDVTADFVRYLDADMAPAKAG